MVISTQIHTNTVTEKYITKSGRPHPLGATPDVNGVNFSVFSEQATSVQLLLFETAEASQPSQTIQLEPRNNKTFHFWHVYVEGLNPGAHYAYRIDGPNNLTRVGNRFNKRKVLIDPYAKSNTNTCWERMDALGSHDNVATSMRSVVVDLSDYDWEGDRPLNRPMSESIIYEMHVGGFTRSHSANSNHPGTFSAIIEKIPYLQELGITAVELLPIFDFDETEQLREVDGKPLKDYWGYNPHGFFSLDNSYCSSADGCEHIREFRDLVKAMHKAGIEVILDVVFNHTGEGNHKGPIISLKGFDNRVYYHLVPSDRQYYMDYSGCGNTVNCNHPIVEKLIVECLEYWVQEMHVDGFRFDEGSILSRGQDGTPLADPPVVWHIETAGILAETKIIAEAWDAAGLYQVGYFPGYRWAEWNGKFRDDIRGFVKGDPGLIGAVASRMAGSADIYQSTGHLPINSVNFVTCHDGFTLNDLVSYNDKHNEANGENNQDGINNNLSWNCGFEGPTEDLGVEKLRRKQIKNFASILFLSQGIPMIVAGDEVRRTQQGNNNAYCQDNEISWFDWELVKKNADMFRFFKMMIKFRMSYCKDSFRRTHFFQGKINERGLADISWHGTQWFSPGWDDSNARALAFTIGGFEGASDVHVMMNMHWESQDFEIPELLGRSWYKAIDTAEDSPKDIVELGAETLVQGKNCLVQDRSIAVLISR